MDQQGVIMYKTIVNSKIELSSCGWLIVRHFHLANDINKVVNRYQDYLFKFGDEMQFKLTEMEYKRLEAILSRFNK